MSHSGCGSRCGATLQDWLLAQSGILPTPPSAYDVLTLSAEMQELHALVEKFNTNCVDGSMLLDYCEEEDFDVLIPFAPLRRKFKRCHEDLVRQADIGPGLEESITTMELHHGLKQLNETMHIIATALTQQQGQAHAQQGQTSFTYAAAPVTRPTYVQPAAAAKATEVMVRAEPAQTLMAVQSQEARAEPAARSQAADLEPREIQEKVTDSVHAGEASVREASRPALARALAASSSEPSPLEAAPVPGTARKSLKETPPATARDRHKTKGQAAPILAGAAVAAAAGMAVGASLHQQTERSLADEEGEEHGEISGEDDEAEVVDLAHEQEREQQRAADEAKRIKKERMEKMRKRKEARLKEEQKLKKEVRTHECLLWLV